MQVPTRLGQAVWNARGIVVRRLICDISLPSRQDQWLLIGSILLFTLGTAYHYVGFRSLLFGQGETIPIDFRLRWVESHLLIQGKDSHTWGHPDPELPARLRWQRGLGGGYPPWATAMGLIFAPPVSWPVARWWFAIINLLAIAFAVGWAFHRGRAHSRHTGLFFAASTLASAPAALCVSYGQYALVVLAGTILTFEYLDRDKQAAAGICLGMTLIKPQLGGLLAVVALLRHRHKTVASAALLLLLGSAVAWAMTGIDPYTMLRDSQADAKKFAGISVNPLTQWLFPICDFETTTLLLGLSFTALISLITAAAPQKVSFATLVAVAIVASMFWSYRRGYDCAVMILPMVLLFDWAAKRQTYLGWLAALAFGLSLWLPIRNEQWSWMVVQIGHLLVWTGGTILLLTDEWLPGQQLSLVTASPAVMNPAEVQHSPKAVA